MDKKAEDLLKHSADLRDQSERVRNDLESNREDLLQTMLDVAKTVGQHRHAVRVVNENLASLAGQHDGPSDTSTYKAKWKTLMTSARWLRHAERTQAESIRCGVCWQIFEPGTDGAAVFTEERGALVIRACPTCEVLLHTIKVPNS
jgi:hypothetical protein